VHVRNFRSARATLHFARALHNIAHTLGGSSSNRVKTSKVKVFKVVRALMDACDNSRLIAGGCNAVLALSTTAACRCRTCRQILVRKLRNRLACTCIALALPCEQAAVQSRGNQTGPGQSSPLVLLCSLCSTSLVNVCSARTCGTEALLKASRD
jgi:hypothetical protein